MQALEITDKPKQMQIVPTNALCVISPIEVQVLRYQLGTMPDYHEKRYMMAFAKEMIFW